MLDRMRYGGRQCSMLPNCCVDKGNTRQQRWRQQQPAYTGHWTKYDFPLASLLSTIER